MIPALNITDTVTNLISLPHEYEWLDFKENWFSKDEIGEYISLVTIPFNKIDAAPFELNAGEEGNIEGNEKGTESDQKIEKWPEKWPEKIRQILAAIKNDSFITIVKLEEELGLGHTTVKKMLSEMQKENLIRRIGPDKGGHWEVVEK